jgi:hypothetical protein
LLIGEKSSGHVQLINHKSCHHEEYNAKYTKFAYSSIFSYEARRIHGSLNCDNVLQFSSDGIAWHQRNAMQNLHCEPGFAASRYRLAGVDEEGEAVTYTLVKSHFLVNFHRVVTEKDLFFREGGYPLGFEEGGARTESSACTEAAWKDGRLTCIRNLCGYEYGTRALPHGEDVGGSNVRYAKSVVPALHYRTHGRRESYLASMVCAKVGEDALDDLERLVSGFRVTANSAFIRFHDREEAYLQIGQIREVEVRVGGVLLSGPIVMARVTADGRRQVLSERVAPVPAQAARLTRPGRNDPARGWRWLCR